MSETLKKKQPFPWQYCILPGLATVIIVGAVWLSRGSTVLPKEIRNILLISIDTCRADYLSCYGYQRRTTPNIDAIAKRGVLFENAIAPTPITRPSHSSMFTGTIPPYHGVHDNHDYKLGQSNVTLAEILRRNGFTTGAIIGSFVMDSQFGLDQGFNTYNDDFKKPFNTTGIDERRGEEINYFAIRFLEKHKDKKFFLFLHYFDPHAVYTPPEPFASKFADSPYAGEIAYVDYCIGRVIKKLKQLGQYDSTLIIITSDHGEMLGEHGEETHSYFIYQSAVKVPLIIKTPAGPKGKKVNEVAGLIDIVPTVCGLLGITPPSTVHGKDLSGFFNKKRQIKKNKRYIYCESLLPNRYDCTPLLGVVNDRWKYIQAPRPELYDLNRDPGENENLVDKDPKRAHLLQEYLKLILQQPRTDRTDSKLVLDEESRKRLESLGYVASGSVSENFEFDYTKNDPKDLISLHMQSVKLHGFIRTKQYSKAETLARQLLAERPQHILNYRWLGRITFKQNKLTESIKYYSKFLSLMEDAKNRNPTGKSFYYFDMYVHEAYHNLGRAFLKLRYLDKAVTHLSKALQTEPNSPQINYELGNAYLELDKLDEAVIQYNKSLQSDPNYPEAHFNLGIALFEQGKLDAAIISYKEALRLKPDWKNARRNLDIIERKKKELEGTDTTADYPIWQPDINLPGF